jgi:predicted AAA+ superfamily ATPase
VLHTNADAIPLGSETKIRISKFLFIDIGLLLAAQGMPTQAVIDVPLELAGQGALAEQFVGQQLLYAQDGFLSPELYYWQPPKSEQQAEVDFLFVCAGRVYPIEVKSGRRGSIKSLQSYVMKKEANLAVQISSAKPSAGSAVARVNKAEREFTLLRIPFYLVNKLEALLNLKNGNASPHDGCF